MLEKTGKTKAQVLLAYNELLAFNKYITDTKKDIETFKALFAGKDISDKEMKTIEDIISICTPGFVAKCVKEEVEIFEHGRVMPIVTVEDCKGEKGKWIPRKSIEPNIPDEFPDDIEIIDTDDMKDKPMPKPIPYKGR